MSIMKISMTQQFIKRKINACIGGALSEHEELN